MAKRALVLSGGGMFGAWQAGAWSVLASHFRPDLIVGASVGSLNGYAIAAGCTPSELLELWRRPDAAGFRQLPATVRSLVEERPLKMDYAVVLVDALRLREETFRGAEVTWRHLVASCVIPGLMLPYRIGAKWYVDGGLLNVLPVRAAIALGATEMLALNAIPSLPIPMLGTLVRGLRTVVQKDTGISAGMVIPALFPRARLGSLRDACFWRAENVERWYAQGTVDASAAIEQGLVNPAQGSHVQNISSSDCLKP